MKRFYVLFLSIVLIPSILFAWTEPTGSTFTVTSTESQEVKDILNDVHDSTHASLQVTNISTGAYHNRTWVWDSDFGAWIELMVSSCNTDGVGINTRAQTDKVLLYGFDGTGWDRLKSDELHNLITKTSTNSTVALYYNGLKAIIDSEGQLYVQTSTDSYMNIINIAQLNELKNVWITSGVITTLQTLQTISELNSLKNVWVSSGIISNIQKLDELNSLMNVWITSGVISTLQTISELNSLRNIWITSGTITSLGDLNSLMNVWITSGVITTLENISQLNELKNVWITSGVISVVNGVLESSGVIKNFPTDYPDSTSASAISNVATAIDDMTAVLKSSVPVISVDYTNKVSTGTAGKVLVSGNIAISNWNMDIYSFYSVGGDTEITSTWMGGIIYALDGIPVAPIRLSRPVTNPTFQCSMSYGTTLYYILNGVGN